MPVVVETTIDPGGTGDYASASLWDDDWGSVTDGECTTHDQIAKGICISSDGSADIAGGDGGGNGGLLMRGWTADASRYPWLWTDPTGGYRHESFWDDNGSFYRIMKASAFPQIEIRQKYFRCSGIAFKHGATFPFNGALEITREGVILEDCILQGKDAANGYGIYVHNIASTGAPICIRNCIVQDYVSTTNSRAFWATTVTGGSRTYFHNCAAINSHIGFEVNGAPSDITNCFTFDTITTPYVGTFGGTNNGYDSGSDPTSGGTDLSGYAGAELFENYAGGVYRTYNHFTNPLLRAGANIFSHAECPVKTDVRGEPRYDDGGTYDLGLYQFSLARHHSPFVPGDGRRNRRHIKYFFMKRWR